MTRQVAVFALLAVGVAGCSGHAELLKRDASGGVFALRGDRRKAMEDARVQMGANCPSGYEITGEELDRMSETTTSESESEANLKKNDGAKSTKPVTEDVKEYRILYDCRK